mmetsp:Transcript_112674/g.282197  ORF Transcript_112674/g.282197 Transcript_112674/m.282197 type:complete len:211 (-) Transcript_112674:44-676(-)
MGLCNLLSLRSTVEETPILQPRKEADLGHGDVVLRQDFPKQTWHLCQGCGDARCRLLGILPCKLSNVIDEVADEFQLELPCAKLLSGYHAEHCHAILLEVNGTLLGDFRQAEVTQFDCYLTMWVLLIDLMEEDVLRLDVIVCHAPLVHEGQSAGNTLHHHEQPTRKQDLLIHPILHGAPVHELLYKTQELVRELGPLRPSLQPALFLRKL